MTESALTILKVPAAISTLSAAIAAFTSPTATATSVIVMFGGLFVLGAFVALESIDDPVAQRANPQPTGPAPQP